MILVVDTSVALKWMVREVGSEDALKLLSQSLTAPDLIQAEFGNALTRKVRRAEISPEQAERAFGEGLAPIAMLPSTSFAAAAFNLSLRLGHSIYDCYFLAVAAAQNALLVTADQSFATKVRKVELAPLVLLLGEDVPNAAG